jgi:hypothetical protein
VLTVYDLLGREIALLVNQDKSPGTYSVSWDAGNQPGGVYFYRLTTPGSQTTRKLLLIR